MGNPVQSVDQFRCHASLTDAMHLSTAFYKNSTVCSSLNRFGIITCCYPIAKHKMHTTIDDKSFPNTRTAIFNFTTSVWGRSYLRSISKCLCWVTNAYLVTHRHLICELHPYSSSIAADEVRTWLRIVSILQVLTIPTSFPVVQLTKPFGVRAVL